MKRMMAALCGLMVLTACSGNPFKEEPVDPGDPDNDQQVVVPDALKGNIKTVAFVPASGDTPASLQIQITGLDTTPVLATWDLYPALDVPGYTAFKIQEDSLDRMFVGLAAVSGNGAVSAVVAGDGGQFNTQNSGTVFSRTGAFTPPDATGSGPATGQVSYAGDYAGILNLGMLDGPDLLTPPDDADPTTLPGQPVRVRGKAFINANFADNTVGGSVYDRVAVDTGFGLESIILIQDTITANGTFDGAVQRPNSADGVSEEIGIYGGVFGGANAGGVAGAVSLDRVVGIDGEDLENVTERGIFVLNQCGLAGLPRASGCDGTAP